MVMRGAAPTSGADRSNSSRQGQVKGQGECLRRQLALGPRGGVLRQLGSVGKVQLPFDLLAIILDRFDTQVQLPGDLTCALPAADQLENIQFTIRE